MRVLLSVSLLLGSSFGFSAPFVHELQANQQIRFVNMTTQTEPIVTITGLPSDSLAKSPVGTFYIADPGGNLFSPTTSGPIPVGPLGFGMIGDLDWANNGLWGFSNQNQSLFFYDLGLNSITHNYTISSLAGEIVTGVAYRPSDQSIFLSARIGLNNDRLYQVPNATSTANFVGTLSISDTFSYIADIDFDAAENLYGVSFFHRHFYNVNSTNGATSLISTGPHRDVYAMALDPVPEPASLIALGLGFVAMKSRRRLAKVGA